MLRLLIALSLSFVLFAVFYTVAVPQDARGHVLDETADLAQDAGAAIVQTAQGWQFNEAALASLRAGGPCDIAATEAATFTAVGGSSPALLAWLRDAPAGTQSRTQVIDDGHGGVTLTVALHVAAAGHQFLVAAQRPLPNSSVAMAGLVDEFSVEILPTFVPVMALTLLIAWLTIRRSLHPLHRASSQAIAVSGDQPGPRVGLEGIPGEVVPLINAVNGAFDALEAALAVQLRFTANAAHQLRTPLAVIAARLEAMEQDAATLQLRADVARMARLLSQLLATARLQAGQIGDFERLDLAAVARRVLADLSPLADASLHELTLEAPAPVWIRGNQVALEQVLTNLVENALRFAPANTAIEVTVGPGPRLSVRDHGPGVRPENQAKLFEAFWRANDQQAGGSGLGLAIASDIVRLHGGDISVADAPGGGADFRIVFPAAG